MAHTGGGGSRITQPRRARAAEVRAMNTGPTHGRKTKKAPPARSKIRPPSQNQQGGGFQLPRLSVTLPEVPDLAGLHPETALFRAIGERIKQVTGQR